jgi:hypothetical protein
LLSYHSLFSSLLFSSLLFSLFSSFPSSSSSAVILHLLPPLTVSLPLPLDHNNGPVSGSVLLDKAHQHENAISDITTAIELLKSKSLTSSHGLENEIRNRRRGEGEEEGEGEGEEGEEQEETDEEEEEITITIKGSRGK